MFESHEHRARVTATGEIVLPGAKVHVRSIRKQTYFKRKIGYFLSVIAEVVTEWNSMFMELCKNAIQPFISIKKWASGIIGFLGQPITVTRPKRKVRNTTRLWLFVSDSVRFTLSFGFMFAGLFIALNYQSFWEIAVDELNPIAAIQHIAEGKVTLSKSMNLAPKASASQKNADGSSLADFLPQVGPPENRLIIPKLSLNVPLAQPEVQALLRQDWEQVEKDIQSSLEKGVVHYPGTAKPGQAGNFFVTGHSSYYPWAAGDYKTVFARLHALDVGDEYFVYYHGDQHKYIVQSKTEVSPNNTEVLNQPPNKRISTLMTCTPVGTTLRRLILVAEEVDPVTNEILAVGEGQKDQFLKVNTEMLPI